MLRDVEGDIGRVEWSGRKDWNLSIVAQSSGASVES